MRFNALISGRKDKSALFCRYTRISFSNSTDQLVLKSRFLGIPPYSICGLIFCVWKAGLESQTQFLGISRIARLKNTTRKASLERKSRFIRIPRKGRLIFAFYKVGLERKSRFIGISRIRGLPFPTRLSNSRFNMRGGKRKKESFNSNSMCKNLDCGEQA